ncbi:MAG: hypothetical protein QXE90_01325, partial [Candidatus Micrarchaeia archaeon]
METAGAKQIITPLMKRIIRNLPVNIAILDLKGNFIFKNELMKKIPFLRIKEIENNEVQRLFLNAVKGKEGIKHLELKIEDKKRKFIIICNPITDERKKVVGVM